eukprot:256708-Rhodomonas_salina.1
MRKEDREEARKREGYKEGTPDSDRSRVKARETEEGCSGGLRHERSRDRGKEAGREKDESVRVRERETQRKK